MSSRCRGKRPVASSIGPCSDCCHSHGVQPNCSPSCHNRDCLVPGDSDKIVT